MDTYLLTFNWQILSLNIAQTHSGLLPPHVSAPLCCALLYSMSNVYLIYLRCPASQDAELQDMK